MGNQMSAARTICSLLFAALATKASLAYDLGTHGRITLNALQNSQITATFILSGLGLSDGISHDLGNVYLDLSGAPASPPTIRYKSDFDLEAGRAPPALPANATDIEGWLTRGSIREDDGRPIFFSYGDQPQDDPAGAINRFCNHFFDPVTDQSLS